MKAVALVGALQSGKDSVAAFLAHEFDYVRVAFADELKHEIAELLNSNNPRVPGDAGAAWTLERVNEHKDFLRPLLQWYGTEYRRGGDPDYWVRKAHRKIQHMYLEGVRLFAATDGRFTNELEILRGVGARIVELSMPREEVIAGMVKNGLTADEAIKRLNHPSEMEWRSFPKDASFISIRGNLPSLATQVVSYLMDGNERDLGEVHDRAIAFYADMYPEIYGAPVPA